MIEFGGWRLPQGEIHLIDWMRKTNDIVGGRHKYQGKKQDAAIRWCKSFRRAIDCGSHIGLHSFYLAEKFERVDSFEPVQEHRDCFALNVTAPNVTLHACALGDRVGSISMYTKPGSSGDSYINGEGDIPLQRLDDFAFDDVSYWKLDCEGGEESALRGGERTLLRCRPTVMVEQKPRVLGERGIKGAPALDYLLSLGMKVRQELSGDFILNFDD